jgi:hypothetical protein
MTGEWLKGCPSLGLGGAIFCFLGQYFVGHEQDWMCLTDSSFEFHIKCYIKKRADSISCSVKPGTNLPIALLVRHLITSLVL